MLPSSLRNTYFALRHGRSLANEAGIIVSRPENGLGGYGLSPAGVVDARAKLAPERVARLGLTAANTIVLTSDFLRAKQTAEILCEQGGLEAQRVDVRLRERSFGVLEMKVAKDSYETIWRCDRGTEASEESGCEGTDRVRERMLAVIDECESRHSGKSVVLVSHGDPLQILETAFAGLRSNEHRTLPHLETAEIRRLNR